MKNFKPASNTEIMLRMIEASGGMRLGEIQKLMWMLAHPGGDVKKMSRGAYCTYLLGGPYYHKGVLNFFCTKGSDKVWRRNPDVPLAPPWKRKNDWDDWKKSI